MNKLCILFVIALFSNVSLGQEEQNNGNEDLDDRYGLGPAWFPGPGNPFPGLFPRPNQFPNQNERTTTTQAPTTVANGPTTQSPAVRACIASCPVTPEYNPVCGTDMNTYDNPGRLTCAQVCGVNVQQLRTSRCPAPAQTAQ